MGIMVMKHAHPWPRPVFVLHLSFSLNLLRDCDGLYRPMPRMLGSVGWGWLSLDRSAPFCGDVLTLQNVGKTTGCFERPGPFMMR